MKNYISSVLSATIVFFFSVCTFSTAFGQETDYYQKSIETVKSLSLDSAHHGITVYFSEQGEDRAKELGPKLSEAIEFYADSLQVSLNFRLALLTENDWEQFEGSGPYGLPHVRFRDSLALAFLPLEGGGVVYDFIHSLESEVSPELRTEVAETGLSWGEFSGRIVDLIGFHEVGHPYLDYYGIGSPARWFNEFKANYFLYSYLRTQHPEEAYIWDLSTRVILDGYQPEYTTLEDFEKYYSGVGAANYGWYQAKFESMANELFEERGFSFIKELKDTFPKEEGNLSNEEIIERLEKIAPGFKTWANSFKEETK